MKPDLLTELKRVRHAGRVTPVEWRLTGQQLKATTAAHLTDEQGATLIADYSQRAEFWREFDAKPIDQHNEQAQPRCKKCRSSNTTTEHQRAWWYKCKDCGTEFQN